MKVVLLGASGMVGQGVLIECLDDARVESVLSLGRSASGREHSKLMNLVHGDLLDLSPVEEQLRGFDACFFCLGVSSVGMNEADYTRVTYDMTIAVARTLVRLNPEMAMVYVSGRGTDSTENGRVMWARVKGRTENELLRMFSRAYMFRPAGIQPLKGVRPRVGWIRAFYAVTGPALSAGVRFAPGLMTTSERLGKAMINVVARREPSGALESPDINREGAA